MVLAPREEHLEYMEKVRQRELERDAGRKWGLLFCVATCICSCLALWKLFV